MCLHNTSPSQAPGREQEGSGDEDDDLSEEALSALTADYNDDGGQERDPFHDPAWWEAAVAELQNFERMQGMLQGGKGMGMDAEEEDKGAEDAGEEGQKRDEKSILSAIQEADGWVTLSTDRRKRSAAPPAQGGAGGRMVVSGSVEEALRRPRLEAAFGDWMEGEVDEEGGEIPNGDEDSDEEEEEPIRRRKWTASSRPTTGSSTRANSMRRGGQRRLINPQR